MSHATRSLQRALLPTAMTLAVLVVCGCGPAPLPTMEPVPKDELLTRLDDALDFTFEQRHLNLEDHAAWQILHGALAYQRAFKVFDPERDEHVSAVDHVLEGGRMKGWVMEPVKDPLGNVGLRPRMQPGTKQGQGHHDQWLAIIAQCGLPPEHPLILDGKQHTIADFVRQVELDVSRNAEQEFSWTLIGLTTYRPASHEWIASDGQKWSIERLVKIEAEQAEGACGDTHRLIGLSMSLNRHLEQGGKIEGVWVQADERIKNAIEKARQYQNPDGSFSCHYFRRPGATRDGAENLGTTGHTLEFLTLSLGEEELRQPWVQRAALNLCELFRKTRGQPLECGALYHAAHGLVLYRERVYGPRTWGEGKRGTGSVP